MNKQQILQLVMTHKFGAAALAFLATGVGANLMARVLNAVPLAWWFATVKGVAFSLGSAGDVKFGRAVFQPFEDLIQRIAQGTSDAIRDGFAGAAAAGAQKQAVPAPSLELQADKPSPLTVCDENSDAVGLIQAPPALAPKDTDAPTK